MAYLDISSKTASILLNTDGTHDPDQLVGVAAAEPLEWVWLIAELAGWLADAHEHTRADFNRFFGGYRSTDKTACSPHISPRCSTWIAASHEHRRARTIGAAAGCRAAGKVLAIISKGKYLLVNS